MPDIRLTNLGTAQQGLTPAQLAAQATTPFRTPVERSGRAKERGTAGERTGDDQPPHAKRRVLSEGLLDELQALSQQAEELLSAPSPLMAQ